jgi:hypothetical protein
MANRMESSMERLTRQKKHAQQVDTDKENTFKPAINKGNR